MGVSGWVHNKWYSERHRDCRESIGIFFRHLSLENVFKQALAKAGIKRPATLHCLRHSYATHLFESGTGFRYIQDLLGHKSSKTTEPVFRIGKVYTHASTKSLQKVISPFDTLQDVNGMLWKKINAMFMAQSCPIRAG